MEFLLGLQPMTHFDAGARPMTSRVSDHARPGARTRPRSRAFRSTERNPANAPGAAASAQMDFDEADENDDDELNDVLWRAIRKDPPPPAR